MNFFGRCFWLGMALSAGAASAHALPVARVRGVRPIVEVKGQQSWHLARERNALSFGDTVRTGAAGRADVLFNNGTRIALRERSQLEILAPPAPGRPLVVRLVGALSEIFVRAKGPTQVRTAAGVAAVRGTQYSVRLDSETQTTVTVVEGAVDFSNPQDHVLVKANQRSSARVGEAPSAPVQVDASGLLAWTLDVAALPLPFELWAPTATGENTAHFTAANREGAALLRAGDARAAARTFALALQNAPDDDAARAGLALAQAAQGDEAQAERTLQNALATPNATLQNAPLSQSVRALLQLQSGDARGAALSLRAVVAGAPQTFQAQSLLALALAQSGDAVGAQNAAQLAVRAAPRSAMARACASIALFFAGRGRDARREAQLALQNDPLSPLALLAYGRAQTALGRVDEARQAIEQAAVLAPDLPLAQRDLGALYLRLDLLPKAEAAFQKVLAKSPADGVALAGLGVALGRTGREREARVAFDAALLAAPRDALVRAQRAEFLIDQGQLELARAESEAFLRDAGERDGAQLGSVLVRLSEAALYRQNLPQAFDYARRAVRLLPDSAPAHYQFGRVLLEQERNTQAGAQFRLATALDPDFARARYALGLTQELSASGRDFARALGQTDAALEGGPSQALSLRNLQSPGARERIQAAIQDPTVVRTASRSYGDTQIDGDAGQNGTRDGALSVLKESGDRRGVLGLTASHNSSDGVREGADFGSNRASLSLGRKARQNGSGFFALGQVERRDFGNNTGVFPEAIVRRERANNPQLLLGINRQRGEAARTRLLLSAENPDVAVTSISGTLGSTLRGLHGEVRHEMRLGDSHRLSAGASWGSRTTSIDSQDAFPQRTISLATKADVRSQVFYLRDDFQIRPRLTLTGELKALRVRFGTTAQTTLNPALPDGTAVFKSRTRSQGFAALPTFLASYQIAPRTNVRLRARRLLGGVEDFELLSPSDVFLFEQSLVPALNFTGRGRAYELELNHTFASGSFLEVGAFQQHGRNANNNLETLTQLSFRGLRARYEGIVSPRATFFLSGDTNSAHGSVNNFGIAAPLDEELAEVPRLRLEAGAQYLSDHGFFVQPSLGYFGPIARVNDFLEPRGRRGGFTLANLRVGKRQGLRRVVYFEARDLFDKSFAVTSQLKTVGDLGQGRQLVFGFSQRF